MHYVRMIPLKNYSVAGYIDDYSLMLNGIHIYRLSSAFEYSQKYSCVSSLSAHLQYELSTLTFIDSSCSSFCFLLLAVEQWEKRKEKGYRKQYSAFKANTKLVHFPISHLPFPNLLIAADSPLSLHHSLFSPSPATPQKTILAHA